MQSSVCFSSDVFVKFYLATPRTEWSASAFGLRPAGHTTCVESSSAMAKPQHDVRVFVATILFWAEEKITNVCFSYEINCSCEKFWHMEDEERRPKSLHGSRVPQTHTIFTLLGLILSCVLVKRKSSKKSDKPATPKVEVFWFVLKRSCFTTNLPDKKTWSGCHTPCVVISQTHWLVSQERLSPRVGTSVFIMYTVVPSGERWF